MDYAHPSKFKDGTRVLMLVSRIKDAGENKTHDQFVTYSKEEFEEKIILLRKKRLLDQRIYATASSLDQAKAVRKFREAQLQSEYEQDTTRFYRNLYTKWVSSLMKSEDEKHWLFDCDNRMQTLTVRNDLTRLGIGFHTYLTKNGRHYITRPFNPTSLRMDSKECLMKNPLILWSY